MMMVVVKRGSQNMITKNLTRNAGNYCDRNRFKGQMSIFDKKQTFAEFKFSLLGRTLGFDYDFSSNKRPDSVLNLLDTFGFPSHIISLIVRHNARILTDFCPRNYLMPKLNYLFYITRSESTVMSLFIRNPHVLSKSFDSYIVPVFNLVESVSGGYKKAADFLADNPPVLFYTEEYAENLLLNARFLLEVGVSHFQILKLMKDRSRIVKPHDDFHYAVLKLKDLGFDLSSTHFYNCIKPMTILGEYAWESRCVLFKSFGFSDHEIISTLKKVPQFMTFKEELISEKLDFFLNKLQWTPFLLSSYAAVLNYGLETKTMPRCSVLQVLVSKRSTSEGYMLSKILAMTDEQFFEDFVSAHEDEVPKIMKAYEGKLKFKKYTFKQMEQDLKPS